MQARIVLLPLLLLPFAACSASPNGTGGTGGTGGGSTTSTSTGTSTSTSTSTSTGTSTSTSTSTSSGGGTGGGSTTSTSSSTSTSTSTSSSSSGLPADTAVVRVHYPAAGKAITVRGSAAGLSWTQGQATMVQGDTFTYTIQGITSPVEWKPLLDDTTWARGPNYHVAPGETVDVYPRFTTTKGKVVTLIASFHSNTLDNNRPIYAYLPPSYDENTLATYPVVYMHDGQNLWAALPQLAFGAPWNVDSSFDAAAETGTCSANGLAGWGAQPLGGSPVTCTGDGDCPSNECRTFPEAIVIGVANNADRIYEYTPTPDPGYPNAGGADLYVKMIVEELKPTIDGMLRTRPGVSSTALAGSSLGGLVTAYAGYKHPEVFGMVAELSPSTWWNNGVIIDDVKTTPAAPARPLVVYVDSGDNGDGKADTDLLAAAYLGIGYVDGKDFRHVVQAGASHNEIYWAQRFPGAMQLLLGVR